eukprot:1983341-Prymnesium_polylepis.1
MEPPADGAQGDHLQGDPLGGPLSLLSLAAGASLAATRSMPADIELALPPRVEESQFNRARHTPRARDPRMTRTRDPTA